MAYGRYTFRDYAAEVIKLFNEPSQDTEKLEEDILRVSQGVLDIPNLIALGTARKANHVNTASRWLYYDGHLQITISHMPNGMVSPVHDHGVPEFITPYSGQVLHTLYERVDDQTVPGHAELRIVDERVLKCGDIVLVRPPIDIHRFVALTDDTLTLAANNGEFKSERCYYQPEQKTYAVHGPELRR